MSSRLSACELSVFAQVTNRWYHSRTMKFFMIKTFMKGTSRFISEYTNICLQDNRKHNTENTKTGAVYVVQTSQTVTLILALNQSKP